MDAILTILILLIPFYALYKMYEPRIEVVVHPTEKVVFLWYNLFVNGYPTGERIFKKLFTISIKKSPTKRK
nr:MAG TPA: hypothetical protein [Bacteriophage sp.]